MVTVLIKSDDREIRRTLMDTIERQCLDLRVHYFVETRPITAKPYGDPPDVASAEPTRGELLADDAAPNRTDHPFRPTMAARKYRLIERDGSTHTYAHHAAFDPAVLEVTWPDGPVRRYRRTAVSDRSGQTIYVREVRI
jgi:hypothetical protein